MRRWACALLSVSVAGGCVSNGPQTDFGGAVGHWGRSGPPGGAVPGVCGPHGEKIAPSPYAMGSPYGMPPMMGGMPPMPPMMPGMPGMPPLAPPGVPNPGAPAVAPTMGYGPGGNVTQASFVSNASAAATNAAMAANSQARFAAQRTQVRFVRPSGMKVSWFTQGADGRPTYSSVPLEAPARYNFPQGAIYRLKLSNIEGRPGLEVYPTMEVVPTNPKTEAFLAHSAVPIDFTAEDFKQVAEGHYVVKVIYLPDPQFQDVASTGTEEILSTRLEPGVDPIHEAMRRGSILVVLRLGNVDQEAPNTPPLSASAPGAAPAGPPVGPMGNFGPAYPVPPGMMVPFGPGGVQLPPGAIPPGAMVPGMPPGVLPPSFVPAPGAPAPGAPRTPVAPRSIVPPPPPPGIPSVGPAGDVGRSEASRPDAVDPTIPPNFLIPAPPPSGR